MNERQKAAKAKPKSLGRRVADGDISISEAGDIALGITSRQPRDGETLSDDEIRKMLDDWRDSMIEVVRLRQEVAALRAQLTNARAELKRWDELRRAVAECTGQDSAAWPEHGNAPLAIASTVALQRLKLDQIARAAFGEDASHQQTGRARSEESDNG